MADMLGRLITYSLVSSILNLKCLCPTTFMGYVFCFPFILNKDPDDLLYFNGVGTDHIIYGICVIDLVE